MPDELSNKTILITGAGGDLGKEIVKRCIKKKWRIIALTTNKDKLKEFISKFNYQDFHIYEFDFTTVLNKEAFNFLQNYKFNYIILNAGYLNKKPFVSQTSEEVIKHLTVNFTANIFLVQFLLEKKLLHEKAHILAIGSLSGSETSKKFSGMSIYGASKAALHNLFQTLAAEYDVHTYVFTVISLGVVETKMKQHAFPDIPGEPPSKIASFIINYLETNKEAKNNVIIELSKSAD